MLSKVLKGGGAQSVPAMAFATAAAPAFRPRAPLRRNARLPPVKSKRPFSIRFARSKLRWPP